MAGLVESFCLKMVPETDVAFLIGLCTEYQIVVPNDKLGDKPYLVKVVIRHLTSAEVENSADHGAAKFLKLYNELGQQLSPNVFQPKQEDDSDVSEKLSYHKLRQFKINGTIGDPGQKNCLSFSSLCYQIKQGETQGYSMKEIYAGVIRAIEAGNPFRDVLELEADDFDKQAFLKTLRSHFMEKDPNEVFNELRTAVQAPNETAHKFCCRCVALKKKIKKLYESEGIPFEEDNLSATFFRTIYTGLRQTSIRNELRQILKEGELADEDLLVEVSMASSSEQERARKLGGSEKKVNIQKLTVDSDSEELSEPQLSDSSSFSSSSNDQGKSGRKNDRKKQAGAAKNANKSQQKSAPQTQNSTQQNNGQNQIPQDTFCTGTELGKMVAAIEQLSSSNAQLLADINVLKSSVAAGANQNPRFPPTQSTCAALPSSLNPSVAPFVRQNQPFPRQNQPQIRHTSTNRPIYMCEACIQNQS